MPPSVREALFCISWEIYFSHAHIYLLQGLCSPCLQGRTQRQGEVQMGPNHWPEMKLASPLPDNKSTLLQRPFALGLQNWREICSGHSHWSRGPRAGWELLPLPPRKNIKVRKRPTWSHPSAKERATKRSFLPPLSTKKEYLGSSRMCREFWWKWICQCSLMHPTSGSEINPVNMISLLLLLSVQNDTYLIMSTSHLHCISLALEHMEWKLQHNLHIRSFILHIRSYNVPHSQRSPGWKLCNYVNYTSYVISSQRAARWITEFLAEDEPL